MKVYKIFSTVINMQSVFKETEKYNSRTKIKIKKNEQFVLCSLLPILLFNTYTHTFNDYNFHTNWTTQKKWKLNPFSFSLSLNTFHTTPKAFMMSFFPEWVFSKAQKDINLIIHRLQKKPSLSLTRSLSPFSIQIISYFIIHSL